MSETTGAQIHPTAVVDPGAEVGAGSRVWHFVHVCAGARVGADVVLGQNVYVGPGVVVGDGSRVQNNVSLYDGVTLEGEVFVGPSAVFTNVRHPRAHVSRKDAFEPTHVGRRASIGANATIVCGSRIGPRAFVAAGAVVTRDVPPGVLVMGAPARAVGLVCGCGERLEGDRAAAGEVRAYTCAACGASWEGSVELGIAPAAKGA